MKGPILTLWRFRDLTEALIAKGKLESAGIESFLADENIARMNWLYSNLIGGVSLQVEQHRAAEALELLQQPIPEKINSGQPAVDYLQPRCPKCSSLDVGTDGINTFVTYATCLASGF